MATKIYALESATYRAAQNIDDAIADLITNGMPKNEAMLKGIASFAPECAMLKVQGSEVLDYCVDEGVQIHGGMGYSAETRIERSYRDSRINRIFEGTNEINRMLTVDMILKKAMKGELDLMGPATQVANDLMGIPEFGDAPNDDFELFRGYVKNHKKAILMVAGAAVQKLMTSLAKEQEVLMNVADMIIQTYAAESILLRVEKRVKTLGLSDNETQINMMKSFIYEANEIIHNSAKEALWSFAEGDELKMMLIGLKRFTKMEAFNIKDTRQQIAQTLIDANEYSM
jgi:alkylation response protein AidB-like acyl-CoA dehydrogenase